MAGRKQHYIPQSLLRGFETSRSGRKVQVVVYKHGAVPFVTSTEGIAAQRDFYSTPSTDSTDTLDDLITNFEKERFNPILNALRNVGNGDVEPESAATAVVHLAVRAAHLRGSFATVASKMLNHMSSVFDDGDAARDFVGIDSDASDSQLAREIAQQLDALPTGVFSPKEKSILGQLIRFRVRETFEQWIPIARPLIMTHLGGMEAALPSAIENSHIRVLEGSLAPNARVMALMKLRWQVVGLAAPAHFILPDCVAISCAHGSYEEFEPYTMNSVDEVGFVAMPISSTQLLIGTRDSVEIEPQFLNLHFARCSLEFFVSSKTDQHMDVLAREIGAKTHAIAESLIQEDRPPQSVRHSLNGPKHSVGKIDVCFFPPGVPRENEIASAIRRLFDEQCGCHESDHLDSIVVTTNVPLAVSELRGRPLTQMELKEVALGAVEIVGNGRMARIRVLIPSHTATSLLLPETEYEHKLAVYIVKYNLGRVTYLAHWISWSSQRSPRIELGPRQNLNLEFVSRFASHYFGARVATPRGLNMADGDESIHFAQVITGTFGALEEVRRDFWSHRNVDRLASEAFAVVDLFIGTTAATCGTYASQAASLPDASSAGRLLAQHELLRWLRLFERDLRRHVEMLGQWESIDEALGLAAHVDRILWQFGIFVSDSAAGQLWIDICDDARLAIVTQILKSESTPYFFPSG